MKSSLKMLLESAHVSFSMYSAIPLPQLLWTEQNMKYALCFFPLIGVVEALIFLGWSFLCKQCSIGDSLFAAVATAIPILLSGGIHMDGFCDTVDALASHQPEARKLEILKDPHTGAFAVMACVLYLLLTFALWVEGAGGIQGEILFAIGLVLSRAWSGLSVVSFPCAKTSGLAATFSDAAEKRRVRAGMLFWIILSAAGMLAVDFVMAAVALAGTGLMFFLYYRMATKEFGGITGDLAGFFLQGNQFFLLAILSIGGILR